MTILLQTLIPIGLVVLLQAARDFSVQSPVKINETTYYPMKTQDELIKKINSELNKVYYVPKDTEITQKIMEPVRRCLDLMPESKYCLKW